MLTLVIIIVLLALVFDYINGMHDCANAIATVVSTRVLSPLSAVLIAATLNFAGAFLSVKVAKTIGGDIADPTLINPNTLIAALVAAIIWNLITWAKGIPSSSSHALIGGIIGGVISQVGFEALKMAGVIKILKALVLSPILGFAIAYVIMLALYWVLQSGSPGKINSWFKRLQLISAGFMALSHGSNDAQKSMGIIAMALVAGGFQKTLDIPAWVIIACATAMALGTSSGGWRIIKTMGHKMIKLQPVNGFAAETSASIVILTASHMGIPVSTTHCISGSIMGVGATRGLGGVRWSVAGQMGVAWVLTIPATALIAMGTERLLHFIF